MQKQVTDAAQVAAIAKILGVTDLPKGATLTVTAPKSVAGRECACGCGGKTRGGVWVPGHDAKRKSVLFGIIRSEATADAKAAARKELTTRGWPQPAMPIPAEAVPTTA